MSPGSSPLTRSRTWFATPETKGSPSRSWRSPGCGSGSSPRCGSSAVDLGRHRLTIAESVTEVGGRLSWTTPKTHYTRAVPFPPSLLEPIRSLCAGKEPEDLVFTSPEGWPLRLNNWRRRVFDPACKELGLKVSPHDLRHTAASLAIQRGANVKAVQRMLGHASAAMTLDVYAGLFSDDLDSVAVALDPLVPQMCHNGYCRSLEQLNLF